MFTEAKCCNDQAVQNDRAADNCRGIICQIDKKTKIWNARVTLLSACYRWWMEPHDRSMVETKHKVQNTKFHCIGWQEHNVLHGDTNVFRTQKSHTLTPQRRPGDIYSSMTMLWLVCCGFYILLLKKYKIKHNHMPFIPHARWIIKTKCTIIKDICHVVHSTKQTIARRPEMHAIWISPAWDNLSG